MHNNSFNFTAEEFLISYRAAPPEIRKEVRRVLAEDAQRRGDFALAERIMQIKN